MECSWSRNRLVQIAIILCALLFLGPLPGAASSAGNAVTSLSDIPPDQAASILGRLSDEQVRQLVLAGIENQAAAQASKKPIESGLTHHLRQWLHVLDHNGEAEADMGQLVVAYPRIPADIVQSLRSIGGGSTGSLLVHLLLILIAFLIGGGGEWFVRRFTNKFKVQLSDTSGDAEGKGDSLWGGVLQLLPSIVALTAFGIISLAVFMVLDIDNLQARATFMAILLAILIARGLSLLAFLLCWPDNSFLRILPLDDSLGASMYQGARFFAWYVACGLMLLSLLQELGVRSPTFLAVASLLGTLLLLLIAVLLRSRKTAITQALLASAEGREISWTRRQLASSWPLLALFYLTVVWLIWISALVTGGGRDNGALLISLVIVPIYLLFDRVGQWLVGNIINTLGIAQAGGDEQVDKEAMGEGYVSPELREHRLHEVMTKVYRGFVALVLLVWLLYLWGFEFPLAANIVKATFDILITLTLALFIWRYASRLIERKLKAITSKEEVKEIHDDEFGPVVQRGRSYTLLPMLRKFIASSLLVMVTLIILSAIGVDIGPLLAGAGVVGLAIGFGAQKMVSDVLSGLFYLLDDAFRVGEYITAGSISGTVEAITLRNAILRHHRGMLQIVPHSEMGSITNYMRGGIIVKFNLEFPYDTDVDQVRKIIKKVGEKMLADEELGPDFILPLKSQGVSEITNSVMIIRVKFTAHPGKQFVIRREAFRLITEALAAKGIHYAHRKVIVEVPQTEGKPLSTEQVQKTVEAGAAAGNFDTDADQKKQSLKEEPEGMPGM
jgi:small-conductance mechanosensitive channel